MSTPTPVKNIEVQDVSFLSVHHEALIEVGKEILKDSVSIGRKLCKFMIGTSTGAIPVYLAILTFLLPKDFQLGIGAGVTITVPAVGFLIAAILFTIGYLPISARFSLDIIEEVEAVLEKSITYRKCFIWSGMIVFIVSTLSAIIAIVVNIGVK